MVGCCNSRLDSSLRLRLLVLGNPALDSLYRRGDRQLFGSLAYEVGGSRGSVGPGSKVGSKVREVSWASTLHTLQERSGNMTRFAGSGVDVGSGDLRSRIRATAAGPPARKVADGATRAAVVGSGPRSAGQPARCPRPRGTIGRRRQWCLTMEGSPNTLGGDRLAVGCLPALVNTSREERAVSTCRAAGCPRLLGRGGTCAASAEREHAENERRFHHYGPHLSG